MYVIQASSSVCVVSSSPYSVKGRNAVKTNVSSMGDGRCVEDEDGAGLLHRNRQQFYQNMLVSRSVVSIMATHCYLFSRLRCRSCWRSLQQVHRAAYQKTTNPPVVSMPTSPCAMTKRCPLFPSHTFCKISVWISSDSTFVPLFPL